MFPGSELDQLRARKRGLRTRIRSRREDSVTLFTRASQPLTWIDTLRAKWAQIAPFTKLAAIPLGLLMKRTVFPKANLLGLLLRWGPIAWSAWKSRR